MRTLCLLALIACSGDDPTDTSKDDGPTDSPPTTDTGPDVPVAPLCGPAATLPTDHVVEGDTFEVSWACTGPTPQAEYDARLVQGPPGATFDEGTWTASMPTGLADAGPQAFLIEVTHGTLDGLPESGSAEVSVTDAGPGVAGNDPVDPLTYRWEFGLPVIHLFPAGGAAALTEDYLPATTVVGGEELIGAQMKLRGAASLSYPKNSYTLLSEPDDKFDLDDHGLDNRERLVLISTFDDNSYMRQKLVYDLWEDMAAHFTLPDRPAPHAAFTVVYLDGDYHGLFVSVDHIDDEYWEQFGLDPLGNVYKSVNHDANFTRMLASGQPKTDLTAGWEKKEGLPEWDWSDLEGLTAFAADSDAATFWASAPDWIDVQGFQDWFLLVSFASAADSAGKNAYLYNRLGTTTTFFYTPWDMNHSWGQSWTTERTSVTAYDDFRTRNRIFAHFHDDPLGSVALWGRYASLAAAGGPFTADHLLARFGEHKALIEPSARRDWAVWADEYNAFSRWSFRTDLTDVDGEWAYLEQWLTDRPAAFDVNNPF